MKQKINIVKKNLSHDISLMKKKSVLNIKLTVYDIVAYIKIKNLEHRLRLISDIEKIRIIKYLKPANLFEHKITLKGEILEGSIRRPMLVADLDSSYVNDIDDTLLTDLYYVTE